MGYWHQRADERHVNPPQTGPIKIHCAAELSVQCNKWRRIRGNWITQVHLENGRQNEVCVCMHVSFHVSLIFCSPMMEFLDESYKPVVSCLYLAIYIAILKIFSQSRFYPRLIPCVCVCVCACVWRVWQWGVGVCAVCQVADVLWCYAVQLQTRRVRHSTQSEFGLTTTAV